MSHESWLYPDFVCWELVAGPQFCPCCCSLATASGTTLERWVTSLRPQQELEHLHAVIPYGAAEALHTVGLSEVLEPAVCFRVPLDTQEEHRQWEGLEEDSVSQLLHLSQEQISKKMWFLLPVQRLKERKGCWSALFLALPLSSALAGMSIQI